MILAFAGLATAKDMQKDFQLHVVDQQGKALSYSVKSFTYKGKEFASSFRNLRAPQIPWGVYEYTLAPTGSTKTEYGELKGRIDVIGEGKQWKTIVAYPKIYELVDVVPLRNEFGMISPPPAVGTPSWVRVAQAADGLVLEETPVESDGRFQLHIVTGGKYLLTVWSGDEVIANEIRSLTTPKDFPLKIQQQPKK
jgi:hypothetical protein